MLEHERGHRDEYKFRCDKCGKGFSREKLIKDHKCKAEKEVEDKQPELFRRKTKRKVGRPKKRMITVTEEIQKERAAKRMLGRKMRPNTRGVVVRGVEMDKEPDIDAEEAADTDIGGQTIDHSAEAVAEAMVAEVGQAGVTMVANVTIDDMGQHSLDHTQQLAAGIMAVANAQGHHIQVQTVDASHMDPSQMTVSADGVTTQVITIEPGQFDTEVIDASHITAAQGVYEGQVETLQPGTADMGALGTATLISTGPGTATLVVNHASADMIGANSATSIMVPSNPTYVTAEQLESYQTQDAATVFQNAQSLLQASADMLQTTDQ